MPGIAKAGWELQGPDPVVLQLSLSRSAASATSCAGAAKTDLSIKSA